MAKYKPERSHSTGSTNKRKKRLQNACWVEDENAESVSFSVVCIALFKNEVMSTVPFPYAWFVARPMPTCKIPTVVYGVTAHFQRLP
jgi:hypothetical protein